MKTIGKALREARESLGLTLEEVERSTRIRAVRLEALEKGDFESLPSRVQVQGFLRNYADFLGLDPEGILELFTQGEAGAGREASRKVRSVRRPSPIPVVRKPRGFRIYGDQIITGGVALAVIAILVWGTNRIIVTLDQPSIDETASITNTVPAPTDTPTSTPQLVGLANPPTEATIDTGPTITPTLLLGLVDSIELELLAEQSTFVQVIVDGREEFQGRMVAGERLSFRGEDRVEVVTGNARGLRVFFNDQDQGLLGQVNQVITQVWTIRGMQTPTPTQTLTPTASLPVQATPTTTITPVSPANQVGG
jgi:cytoskeletal protein RodZ